MKPKIKLADSIRSESGERRMVAKTETKRKKGPGRPPKSAASKINDVPATDDMLAMYKDMLLIRRFEEKAGQLYGMGQIGGSCHLYIG